MANLNTTVSGYTRYRGREGQWAFMLHRITGLGTLLFLLIHIVDTSFVYFAPHLYRDVMELYRSTIFGIGELALVFSVFFHGVNGLRIAVFDLFAPRAWMIRVQRNSTVFTLIITLILWVPAAAWMIRNLLYHNFGLFGG